MGHGRGVVAGELGVVDEFLEADVVVVLRVAGDVKRGKNFLLVIWNPTHRKDMVSL